MGDPIVLYIYQLVTEDEALMALEYFEHRWDSKYTLISLAHGVIIGRTTAPYLITPKVSEKLFTLPMPLNR